MSHIPKWQPPDGEVRHPLFDASASIPLTRRKNPGTGNPIPLEKQRQIQELNKKGVAKANIALAVGVSRSTVDRYLGITQRPNYKSTP